MKTENKKIVFALVVFSCFISFFAFVQVLVKRVPNSQAFQTAVSNSNVSLQVRGGTLTFSSLPTPIMTPVDTDVDDQTATGSLGTIEVTDLRGARATGWSVNVDSMTDYYNGDQSVFIPLANTTLNVKNLSVKKGDADLVSVPVGNLVPADLNGDQVSDGAITIAQTVGSKNGVTYKGINVAEFGVDVNLLVPGGLPADTYTSSYVISVQ